MNFTRRFNFNNSEYFINELTLEDVDSLQELCERCVDYYEIVEGRDPTENTGYEILTELPPNKQMKDKYVLGVYDNNSRLISVIDIVRGFKVEKEWALGLMMIDPIARGKGLGTKLHNFLLEWLAEYQAESIRIGVVEENKNALSFWKKLGYKEIDRVTMELGNKENTVIVMKYNIAN